MFGMFPELAIEGITLEKSPALRSADGFREMHGKGPRPDPASTALVLQIQNKAT